MSEPTPKEQRGPTNLRIKFRSATLEQFIERYAADVSRGGIFIRTREPLAIGTQLRLELQLQDATPLLAGEGTVIWIRENDPTRQNVTPGMAVRFDKVSPETQPTLDRILGDKARMEEAGNIPTPQRGGGMAVRRPSSVLAPLESASPPAAPAAPERVSPSPDTSRAAPPAATKTSFLASRGGTAPPGTAAPAGPFTRARNTTSRPVPVPSALFEPPTAADIDKALSVLEEAPGSEPVPAAPPVPRFASDDIPKEPAQDPTSAGADEAAAASAAVPEAGAPTESGSAPVQGVSRGTGSSLPAVAATDSGATAAPDKGAVMAPAAPEMSRRFRAASRAYPTLKRRRGTGVVIALIVLLAAGLVVVTKLRPGSRVPLQPVTVPATAIAPAPSAAPAAPPSAAPPEAPPPPAPTPPPAAEAPAAPKPAPAASAPSGGEHAASHKTTPRHHGHDQASATEPTAPKEATAPAPAETKPAEAKPAAEKAPAPEREAAAPAAEKPAAAASILKITSAPAGAEVTIDGSSVGNTPFSSKEIDPGAPHAITLKKDGFETHERMIGASDWSRPHGSSPPSLKVNVKLRRIAPAPAEAPKEPSAPEDTGGPYIKEVPSTP